MAKKLLFLIVLLGLVFVGYNKYHRLLSLERGMVSQWSLISSEYRHKAQVVSDLSQNIALTISEATPYLEQILAVKNSVAEININRPDQSAEDLNNFRMVFQELTDLEVELLALAAQHPELEEQRNYRELITELDGIEITIANERRRLNEQVELYNKYRNGFFNIALAEVSGFREWPTFIPFEGE